MPSETIAPGERLRTWLWLRPWLVPLAFVIALGAVFIYWVPHQERLERAECTRLYTAAHTLADTLSVDARVPFNEGGKGGMNCGGRRRLGVLR